MKLIQTINDLAEYNKAVRKKKVALVPTLGNIHEGHLCLIDLAKKKAPVVVVSIFVNPLQFSPAEDFSSYPRTTKADINWLSKKKVDYLFIPNENLIKKKIFPLKENSKEQLKNSDVFSLRVPDYLSTILCGKSRPHFFHGVASIVFRLFQIIQPQEAVFGEKDYQQFLVIKSMIKDLNLKVQIRLGKTIREPSGLAKSSRNNYLLAREKEQASFIYEALQLVKKNFHNNKFNFNDFKKKLRPEFKSRKITPEYFELLDQRTLTPIESKAPKKENLPEANFKKNPHKKNPSEARVFFAGKLGQARLIDNLKI